MIRPQRVNGVLDLSEKDGRWAEAYAPKVGCALDDGQEHGDDPADVTETENRHHLTFDTYAEGKLTLEEYLGRVFIYQKRQFTRGTYAIEIGRMWRAPAFCGPRRAGLIALRYGGVTREVLAQSSKSTTINLCYEALIGPMVASLMPWMGKSVMLRIFILTIANGSSDT